MAAEEAIEAIHRAVRQGDAVSVTRMLDEDPGLVLSVFGHHALLHTAVFNDQVDLVRLLLERGAEVGHAIENGNTALHFAVIRGHEEMVSTLLTSGADPSRKGYDGQTALIIASWCGLVAVVRLLLRAMQGRVLDERAEAGRTALWFACRNGRADVLRALLLAGADHTVADNNDTTPLQIAEQRERHECVGVIQVSTSLVSRPQGHHDGTVFAVCLPVLYGVAPHNLCLCCSGGRASCSVPMSSTRPGRYTKTPPRASKPLQPQCPPT
jgi:ankyrin repeat protein